MAHQLQLTIRFFSNHYHGSDWPPSPARLFQALVSAGKTGAPATKWEIRHQIALEWLERLGPPEIFARQVQNGKPYTLFVPNNSLDGERSTKTSKPVAPRRLQGHLVGEPDVVYRWPIADSAAARKHLAGLDFLASNLRALGWGLDFAAAEADLKDDAPPEGLEQFTPDARGGRSLRAPMAGFLQHLEESHRAFVKRISRAGVDPYTRPTKFAEVRYHPVNGWRARRCIAFALQSLAGDDFRMRWDQAQTVSAWLRHAAGEALKQEELKQSWIDSYVLGHTTTNERGNRLSFVPLPSIGHQHTDGGIRRVLIVEPPSAEVADREALDLLGIKLPGWVLTDEKGTEVAALTPLKDKSKVLPFYTRGKARLWRTVTPMILHGHNCARGRISLTKTERLLCQGFEAAGFPESLIAEITFQPAPYWSGAGAAREIRVPKHLEQWPRLHVQVEFTGDVDGPVLAGIGRHCGIGVFAAEG
ncbi:MAG: type I-U CRISPR-associated protein Cas5/Cas6 [Candidatus Solibacter usitatus]|nr:type I-U CRISPR-associated protein Cas5/Cas6 [Candidatus Solibacter usitatus]